MAKLTGKAKAKFLARMKKGRKAAKKKGGGKKSAAVAQAHKALSRVALEKRLKVLEDIVNLKFRHMDPQTVESSAEYADYRQTKKKLDAGDW